VSDFISTSEHLILVAFVIPPGPRTLSGRGTPPARRSHEFHVITQTTGVEVLLLVRCFYRHAEVSNKPSVFPFARFFIRLTQERGRVNSCHNFWREMRRENFAAFFRDAKTWSKHCLTCG